MATSKQLQFLQEVTEETEEKILRSDHLFVPIFLSFPSDCGPPPRLLEIDKKIRTRKCGAQESALFGLPSSISQLPSVPRREASLAQRR
jgi:hypothetical protein